MKARTEEYLSELRWKLACRRYEWQLDAAMGQYRMVDGKPVEHEGVNRIAYAKWALGEIQRDAAEGIPPR